MHKSVLRGTHPILPGKAATGSESISKFDESADGIFLRVWSFNAMMQMDSISPQPE